MEQNWVMYPNETDEGVRLVGVNIALSSVAPDSSRPMCTLIYIYFTKPGDDGMGDSKERDAIGEMEDALAQTLEKKFDALHVASVRGGGAIGFWIYSKPRIDAQIEQEARAAFPNLELEFQSRMDPKWEGYWDLLPDTETMREIADMHLVALLESKGDDLVTPRPVDHFAVFAEKREAEQFMRMAAKHEFETRFGESDENVLVIATREDPVDLESIQEVTALLSNLAEQEGGEYDGWETRVVEKK